jgi:hypothetical protein
MATDCLQAACSLISILPENPDIAWFVRVTPWWSDDSTATFVVVCMFPGANHFTKLILELNFNTKLQFKREAECQISFGICISI